MTAFYADPYVDAAEQYLKDKAEREARFPLQTAHDRWLRSRQWSPPRSAEPGCGLEPA